MTDALIRSVLHMDPDKLSDQKWAHQVRMSEWALAVMQADKIGRYRCGYRKVTTKQE